jgi:hypothetical protein
VVSNRILDPGLPALDQPKRRSGVVGAGKPDLGRRVAREIEEQESAAPGPADIQVERSVPLEVHHDVGRGWRANRVPVQSAGPASLVQYDIEQCPAIVGPGHLAGGPHQPLVQECAGGKLLDENHVLLGSGDVHRIGKQAVIGTHLHRTDPEVPMARRHGVLIQHDLLGRTRLIPAAAEDRVLTPLLSASVVEVLIPPLRNR